MSFQSVKHFLKIVWLFVGSAIALLLLLFGYFNLPGPNPREDVSLGMTFSSRYAEALGLDWRDLYRSS
jgi:hypothetical protein